MKNKILATIGAASFALTMSATASHALLAFEPGGTVGLATGAPLPEGVFAIDDALYGKRDGNSGKTGLNIPIFVWSTPVTFYNTRVELIALPANTFWGNDYRFGAPGNGSSGISRNPLTTGARNFNQYSGVILAHDFGNGFGGSVEGDINPADQAFVPHTFANLFAALSYTGNGFDITAQFGYSGTFGSKNSFAPGGPQPSIPGFPGGSLPGFADAVNVNFTATKKFDKVEIGFVGFAHTDIEDALDNSNFLLTNALTAKNFGATGFTHSAAVAVGGLIGYDFGKFTLQGVVTREIASRGAPQTLNGTGKETRGLLRLILPLYVAPAAPAPVVAKY